LIDSVPLRRENIEKGLGIQIEALEEDTEEVGKLQGGNEDVHPKLSLWQSPLTIPQKMYANERKGF